MSVVSESKHWLVEWLWKIARFLLYVNRNSNFMPSFLQRLIHTIREQLRLSQLYILDTKRKFDPKVEEIVTMIEQDLVRAGATPEWSSYDEREKNFLIASSAIDKHINYSSKVNCQRRILVKENLQNNGFHKYVESALRPHQIDEITSALNPLPVYNAHYFSKATHRYGSALDARRDSAKFASYEMRDVIGLPHVAEAVLDWNVVDDVASYFGCLPTLNTVLCTWSFPDKKQIPRNTENIHRDIDDIKQCNRFILLTESLPDNGGHLIVAGSHRKEKVAEKLKIWHQKNQKRPTMPSVDQNSFFDLEFCGESGYGYDFLYKQLFPSADFIQICGMPGTTCLTDAYMLHSGIPSTRDRLLFWCGYTLIRDPNEVTTNVFFKKPTTSRARYPKRIPYSMLKNRAADDIQAKYVFRRIIDYNN